MSKKTAIIIVSVVIIIISLIISIYMPNKEKIDEEIEDKSVTYFLLKRDEKMGVINQDGKIILEPKFDSITIPNMHKSVFICSNGEEKKILNNENKEIFTKYSNIEAIQLTNVISESMYEKNVLRFEKDGKYGLLGLSGNVVLEAKYQEISSLGYKQGEILVKENNKYGIISDKGNTIIKSNYDSIESDQYYSDIDGYKKSGYIVCNRTSDGYRYGYFDYEGSKVLDTEYNQVTRLTHSDDKIYLAASKNGQFGLFINNNKIINTQYQSISYDNNIGMFIVERTGKYGAINEKGIEVLKTEYSDIQIKGIYMYAKKDKTEKIYDKSGNEVKISPTVTIEYTQNPEYYIMSEDNNYSILNSDLEQVSTQKYSYIEYLYGKYFMAINKDGKSGVIDIEENVVIDFNFDLVQKIKEKDVIQVSNFETNITELYNDSLDKVLELEYMNIQVVDDYIKVYNDKEEFYLNSNGDKIENESKLEEIKKSDAILRIGNFKRVTFGIDQYYYIEEN